MSQSFFFVFFCFCFQSQLILPDFKYRFYEKSNFDKVIEIEYEWEWCILINGMSEKFQNNFSIIIFNLTSLKSYLKKDIFTRLKRNNFSLLATEGIRSYNFYHDHKLNYFILVSYFSLGPRWKTYDRITSIFWCISQVRSSTLVDTSHHYFFSEVTCH